MSLDVVVIGAGLAGLTAAWRLAKRGLAVRVLAKGWGATHWSAGCVDVIGQAAAADDSPARALARLARENAAHPYGRVGVAAVAEALGAFQALCFEADYPLQGSLERHWSLPTAAGSMRPTSLAPQTMVAGDLRSPEPMLIAGFRSLPDFFAPMAADNLRAQGIPAVGVTLDLDVLRGRKHLNPVILAHLFEEEAFVEEVAAGLHPHLADAARVGVPAVLGLARPLEVKRRLEALVERPFFEIPTLPPSVPGMRLHRILVAAIKELGGDVLEGCEVLRATAEGNRVLAVYSEAAARQRAHRAKAFVLATGGILGGGIVVDREGNVRETIFELPVQAPAQRAAWFERDFFAAAGQPVHKAGVLVDEALRPVGADGAAVYENLYAAGSSLSGFDPVRELSLEGVAIATGFQATQRIAERLGRESSRLES